MSVFDRIKKIAESHEAKYSESELVEIRNKGNEDFIKEIESNVANHQAERLIGRCGLLPIHQKCSVDNYEVTNAGQQAAKNFAINYIETFHLRQGKNFIFSGGTGTGKNHLAAAICNALMKDLGASCMIVTVNEMMIKLRACYDPKSKMNEDEFIENMVKLDFLVIDELGVQRNNDNEKLTINLIIDRRTGSGKSTGMLTNLISESEDPNARTMTSLLGDRIMSRMSMNGVWVPFNWGDHRK